MFNGDCQRMGKRQGQDREADGIISSLSKYYPKPANEMRNEINRLNALRQAEEKKARERKALSQKITELQMFATDIERNDSYRYLSGE